MPTRGVSAGPSPARLDEAGCWALLGTRTFGRVCSCVDDGAVTVALTTYALRGPSLFFRAAAFGAVARRGRLRPVTLQVDDAQDDLPPRWSVTVSGPASRVDDPATLAALWSPPRVHPWETGRSALWLRLDVTTLRGRRVPAAAR